jgi:excisionase family DNA binding protein
MTLALPLPDELVDAIAKRVAELLAEPEQRGPEPWVGVAEAANHLACKPHRIYGLVHRGEVPHRKDGTRLLFRRSELDAWLDGQASARCHPGAVSSLAERKRAGAAGRPPGTHDRMQNR